MKKIFWITLFLVAWADPVFATDITSSAVNVVAIVDGQVSISLVLTENTSTGATLTSVNFGELEPDSGGVTMHSARNVVISITANTHGLPYVIKQTGSSLTTGSETIPPGSCVVTPVYTAADNAGADQPPGSSLGAAGSWVATDKVLYASESGTAAMRTIQNIYAITSDPGAGATSTVPSEQPGGNYSSSLTLTATTS